MARGIPRRAGLFEPTLIAAAAQILFLDVPDHAAVDLAVEAVKREPAAAPFASLANGVLRNLAREGQNAILNADPLDDETPAWLAERWRAHYGEATARAIAAANRCEATLDVTLKAPDEGWAERLNAESLPTGSLRLLTHAPIVSLPGYDDGAWWVQDAAAALPARLLRPEPAKRILDLCAAPGGKTAQLAAAGADVTAVDRSAERLDRLRANLGRLKLPADLRLGDVAEFASEPFDMVLLDAPCTATGTIRRHPDVAWGKRPGDVAELAALQSRMLDRAAALVRPGGELVYCVCSLEPQEGEAQIAALLARNAELRRVPIDPSEIAGLSECLTSDGDLRTLPCHLWRGEPRRSGLDGFYSARLARLR